MNLPPDPALLQRLRAARRAELAQATPPAPLGGAGLDEHKAALTQVHDDVRTVLVRIDAAEAAMRPVLQAWATDPARGGAHLLARDASDVTDGGSAPDTVPALPTTPWAASTLDEQLPDTVRPGPQDPS